MRNRLIIDGNTVYELDEECARRKPERNTGRGGNGQRPLSPPGQERNQGR